MLIITGHMRLNLGDHICGIYSTEDELCGIVAPYLSEGLRRGERCWFLPSTKGEANVRRGLIEEGIDVDREVRRGALVFADSTAAYAVRGQFDAEETMAVFGAAIEDALNDGFSGFRAAAEMSWVMDVEGGEERIVIYEALLKSLFSNGHATGLCLYHRDRMPLTVIDGALATHPIVHAPRSGYRRNPYYDPGVTAGFTADRSAASRAEYRVKQMSRAQKLALCLLLPAPGSTDATGPRG